MHGHNWKVEVEVCGNKLDNIGMVIDFKEIRNKTNDVVNQLDHRFLNDLDSFKEINPTAENIAKYIYTELSIILNKKQVEVKSIKLWETDKSAVTFTKSHFFIGVSFGMAIRQGNQFPICSLLKDAVDYDEENVTLF